MVVQKEGEEGRKRRRTKGCEKENHYYDDRERRDQVEQPYAGRVPCAGVTAEPLWRRCPRFVAGVLIACQLLLLLPGTAAFLSFFSHTHAEREKPAGVVELIKKRSSRLRNWASDCRQIYVQGAPD